jgi:hypothetical protein
MSNDIPASFNGSQQHESAQPGLSVPTTTVYQTPTITINQTATVHVSGHPSPTSFHYATSTNRTFSGSSKSCSLDAYYLSVHHNSWAKCPGIALIGRVHHTIDSANNKTITSTSYSEQVELRSDYVWVTSHGSYLAASRAPIITRTDVDSNGTVTYVDGTDTM